MHQDVDGRWLLMGTVKLLLPDFYLKSFITCPHLTLAVQVSHGIKCAYPNLPGVYMRMTFYKPWIEKVTGERFS